MKNQLQDCKESVQAKPLVNETLRQLEAAKRTVEFLRADAAKAVHGYNSSALELDESRTREVSLDSNLKIEAERLGKGDSTNHIEIEFRSLRSEVELLRSAIEIAEIKFQEEQIQNTVKIRNAYEFIERIKSESSQRESELERQKNEIEELKEKLLDKENELQGIEYENGKLNSKERELKEELKRLDECVAVMKGEMMDKETTLQSISEENEILKMEINKRFTFSHVGMMSDEVAAEIGAAKAAERDAFAKLKIMIEEAERSNNKAERVTEMLEAARAANTEKEAELKRIKVQCDQWRKAAETAAAMFSAGKNGNIAERSMSMDNCYNSRVMKSNKYSNFYEEIDDWSDLQRKKNGNVLKKIGDLWKKPQKITG
ncbi:interactor of constitutive active ROPs 3 [Lathyrus oleraceus]|uniref:Interactor of constitutive active ROPs 3 n=1 Tax=Pisum sativum TaxID=3888 RepID=A0A9D4X6I1_PEA|nr:interactor of constitutive active ROPs 3-like [Pisum sativum]KAI5413131.1 hypothetical protein KIW84_057659 [Pisum sativum]